MMQSVKANVISLVNNAKQKVVNRMYTLARTEKGAISIEAVVLIVVGVALIVYFFPQAKDLITTGFTKAKGWLDQIS